MPSKKKKYNARFPAGRIKKIMQSDEEIGKVAQAVPVIISRTLELFVESLLSKTLKITNSRNAKTLSTSHMKQCIIQEQRFDFLRELVKNIPDINVAEEAANYNENDEAGGQSSPEEQEQYPDSDTPYDLSMPSTSTRRAAAAAAAADQNGAATHAMHLRGAPAPAPPHGFSINVVINEQTEEEHRAHLKRTAYAMQRVQQQQQQQQQQNSMPAAASNSSFGSSSVIMHTTKFAGSSGGADCPPPKLSRSESTPANQTNWQPHQQPSSRQRLKQQSLSIPAPLNINNNSSNNNAPAKSQPQQQLLLPQSQTAAIPAPIVSYDFCNKPIVKIDYSNLPSAQGAAAAAPAAGLIAAAAAPLSAPANIALAHPTGASAFNFSHAAPVINIDLSNIAVAATTSSLSLSAPAPTPPSAALPLLDPKASSSLSTSAMAAAAPFKPINNNNNININLANKRYPAASNSSFFELDEDYDNI